MDELDLDGADTGDILPAALSTLTLIFSAAYVMRTLEHRGESPALIAAAKAELYALIDRMESLNVGASVELAVTLGAQIDRELENLPDE